MGVQTLHLEAPLCMLHRLLTKPERLLQAVTACSPVAVGWQAKEEERRGRWKGKGLDT